MKGPKALPVLAVLFFASFAGRASLMAAEVANPATGEHAPSRVSGDKPASPKQCITGELAAEMTARLQKLEIDEIDLASRKAEQSVLDSHTLKRLDELEALNTKYQALLDAIDKQKDADISKIAAIYGGMKPAQASAIIAEMDPKFAAGLLRAIPPEQSAPIVAALPPDKAYLITIILANDRGGG